MALSLSSTTRLILFSTSSKNSTPPPTLPSSISPHRFTNSISSPSSLSLSLSSSRRRSLLSHSSPRSRTTRPFVSIDDSHQFDTTGEVSAPNGAKASSAADVKPPVNLKMLFKAYRQAVLVGDIETVAQIESMIYVLEKERDKLDEKVLTLSGEISSGKEKLIRLQADFDNFRKRSEKERLTVRSDAYGEVIESLLPMVDNFERAKQQLKAETEMEKKIDVSYQGIYKQFVEIMRSLRVSVVATVGKPFDPKLHEAIAREESEDYKEGIITQEFRRGFILGDRLLRPAMVKVSSGPGRKKTGEPSTIAGTDEK